VAARLAGRRGPLRIVTVGRLVEVKAHRELPGVLRRVLDAGVDARWLVAGEGPLRGEIEAAARQHGVADRFTLAGEMPFAKVLEVLLDSDLMVHSATVTADGRRESLGVVLLEAGAMGLPVVSCRVGGIPEVVVDGQTGALVPQGDGAAMAEAIVRLSRDPEERRRMGLAAAERVRTHFDNDVLAGRLEDLYDRLMDRPLG
jgi:glycosyltransferase involved in cell wall biosynthesis